MMTDRERFCAIVWNMPRIQSDAIVCLAGEDAQERAEVAAQLMKLGGGPFIVATGGVQDPPRRVDAKHVAPMLYGMGIAPDRVIVENASQHTREQADAVVAMAIEESWHRLSLVASHYHTPRAFLTFLASLKTRNVEDVTQLVAAPVRHVPWWKAPAGMTMTRLELLAVEYAKVDAYAGDVATVEEGLRYLEYWEGR